jgi:hypothetical protein
VQRVGVWTVPSIQKSERPTRFQDDFGAARVVQLVQLRLLPVSIYVTLASCRLAASPIVFIFYIRIFEGANRFMAKIVPVMSPIS